MKMKLIPFVLASSALLFASGASAVSRHCNGEMYIEHPDKKDSITLFRISVSGEAGTKNGARRKARDKLSDCANDVWAARNDLIGSTSLSDLPSRCKGISGFAIWDVDIKSRIAANGCAVWPAGTEVAVKFRTVGYEGCGNNNDTSRTKTFSSSYDISKSVCANGY